MSERMERVGRRRVEEETKSMFGKNEKGRERSGPPVWILRLMQGLKFELFFFYI